MLATNSPAEALFSIIRHNFEQSDRAGSVQFLAEHPRQSFALHVDRGVLASSDGPAPFPQAVVWMRGSLITDLVRWPHAYDSRDPRFGSRLRIEGDTLLAHSLLDLVKSPTPSTMTRLRMAAEKVRARPVTEIERVDRPNLEFLHRAIEESRPAILTGLLDHWKVADWSLEAFKEHFGNLKVVPFLSLTIGDYVDSITNPGQSKKLSYTGGIGLPEELARQFPPPRVLESLVDFPQFWLGGSSAESRPVTGMHCDCRDGFLCQISGRKRIVLYAPDQADIVYPFRAFNTYRPCWTGPDKVDDAKYPLFKLAQPIEVILNPGEILFLPVGWFHCVFAMDPVTSISFGSGPS